MHSRTCERFSRPGIPRDIYISLYHRWTKGKAIWTGPFTAETVADDLNREFENQLAIHDRNECLKVRYEDLCNDPALLDTVKEFVDSSVPGSGDIGGNLSVDEARRNEYALHGSSITTKRTFRWKEESDKSVLAAAREVSDRMQRYCEFWGYDY